MSPPAAGAADVADVAEAAAAAARSTPGVVDLHGGSVGEIATLSPNRRVRGVRVSGRAGDRRVQVHLVARYGHPLAEVADDVRAAVDASLAERFGVEAPMTVDVHVADVSDADTDSDDAAAADGDGG